MIVTGLVHRRVKVRGPSRDCGNGLALGRAYMPHAPRASANPRMKNLG